MTKKAETSRIPLLSEYAYGWCVHQLAPFLDKCIGVAGAMDHRMIDRDYDWYIRLPLVLLTMVFPHRHILLVAHVVNIVCWFDRMPAVWDYMCWCALLETTFVLAAVVSSTSEDVSKRFLPAIRAQLLVLYFSAAFWKLTTSWFDGYYSCSTVLMSELMAGVEPIVPPVVYISKFMVIIAPALVAGMEFAVPAFLLLRPRWGVFLALVFHQTINFMPATYAGGFGISMCARMTVFLPGCASDAWKSKCFLPSAGLVGFATAIMYTIHGGLDCHGGLFLLLALFYFMAITGNFTDDEPHETMPKPASYSLPKMLLIAALCTYGSYATVCLGLLLAAIWAPRSLMDFVRHGLPGLAGLAVVLGFVYGFLFPVFGIMMMASSTMYGNVRNFGTSNHLLVPTGLLQERLATPEAAAAAPLWLADFAGGLVRVEHTTSPTFRRLAVRAAEVTNQLPPRSHELMAEVKAAGRYFEFYVARNYFDRDGDLNACALNDVKDNNNTIDPTADEKYVVPAYELRRVLALARGRREAFELEYSRLPANLRLPSEWRAHVGSSVVLEESGDGGVSTCTVRHTAGSSSNCDESELVLQPPPQWWMTKLLHPYPFPLVEGAGDGVHCTT